MRNQMGPLETGIRALGVIIVGLGMAIGWWAYTGSASYGPGLLIRAGGSLLFFIMTLVGLERLGVLW